MKERNVGNEGVEVGTIFTMSIQVGLNNGTTNTGPHLLQKINAFSICSIIDIYIREFNVFYRFVKPLLER